MNNNYDFKIFYFVIVLRKETTRTKIDLVKIKNLRKIKLRNTFQKIICNFIFKHNLYFILSLF